MSCSDYHNELLDELPREYDAPSPRSPLALPHSPRVSPHASPRREDLLLRDALAENHLIMPDDCVICRESIDLYVCCSCVNQHHFHRHCIQEWTHRVATSDEPRWPTCPVCRTNLGGHAMRADTYMELEYANIDAPATVAVPPQIRLNTARRIVARREGRRHINAFIPNGFMGWSIPPAEPPADAAAHDGAFLIAPDVYTPDQLLQPIRIPAAVLAHALNLGNDPGQRVASPPLAAPASPVSPLLNPLDDWGNGPGQPPIPQVLVDIAHLPADDEPAPPAAAPDPPVVPALPPPPPPPPSDEGSRRRLNRLPHPDSAWAIDIDDGALGPEPPISRPEPPAGFAPLNNSIASRSTLALPPCIPILVPSRAQWLSRFCYVVLNLLLSVALFPRLNLATLITCILLSLSMRACFRALSLVWRWSSWRKELRFERDEGLQAIPVLGAGAAERALMNIRLGPIDERRTGLRLQVLAWIDATIQRMSSAMGVTRFIQTGVLKNVGVYRCPLTAVEVRPTEYRGTAASPDVCEIVVAEVEDIHAQNTSLVLYHQGMVNTLSRSLATMPTSQRYREALPRANRITEHQIPESIYRAVQAGSARVAMIDAAANDIADQHVLGTLQDFHEGSPSTPFTASDIVLLTGAPSLLCLLIALVSLCERAFL